MFTILQFAVVVCHHSTAVENSQYHLAVAGGWGARFFEFHERRYSFSILDCGLLLQKLAHNYEFSEQNPCILEQLFSRRRVSRYETKH